MEKKEKINLKSSKTKSEELNNEKTNKSSYTALNDLITSIKEKQEEFTQILSDYTNKKILIDVIETNDSIIVKADLPRIKKEDVEIAISEDSIDIYAEFEENKFDGETNYLQRERSYGEIRRSVKLPSKVKIKEAEGTFKNSILTIKLPKLVKKTLKLQIE
jgi:HSP20 family protein